MVSLQSTFRFFVYVRDVSSLVLPVIFPLPSQFSLSPAPQLESIPRKVLAGRLYMNTMDLRVAGIKMEDEDVTIISVRVLLWSLFCGWNGKFPFGEKNASWWVVLLLRIAQV